MKNNPLYICYSLPLKNYLVQNGEESLVAGKHIKTDNPFWVFMRNEKLNKLLGEWSLEQKDTWIYRVSDATKLFEY